MGVWRCSSLFLLWLGGVLNSEGKRTFNGFQVYQVDVNSIEEWLLIENFLDQFRDEVDIWKWPEAEVDSLHVLLKPGEKVTWEKLCQVHHLQCKVIINDVAKLVEAESRSNSIHFKDETRHRRRTRRGTDDVNQLRHRLDGYYPTFQEIETWLLDLNRTESKLTLIHIGKTYEQRNLYVVKITAAIKGSSTPAMWVDFGTHAREWISHSSGIYLISNLLDGYYQDTLIRPLVEDMVWYIMPVVNPDGYVYTHTEERYWRKNRNPSPPAIHDGYNNTSCIGVDLNRNWGFHWAEAGVSHNSCSIVYPGVSAMSELETQAIERFILHNEPPETKGSIHAFVSIHAYGQMILTRWSYVNETPPDSNQQFTVAGRMAESMKDVHGSKFVYGQSPAILYAYAGGSPDWAKAVANIKYSYGIELRDRGNFGFSLPLDQIHPTGEELLRGLISLGNAVLEYAHVFTTTPADVSTVPDYDPDNTTQLDNSTSSDMIVASSTSTIPCLPLCLFTIVILINNLGIYVYVQS